MKLNLKNTLLSVIVLASLVGCGSDGGGTGGNLNYGNFPAGSASEYVDTARGLPSSLSTADELSQAIVNNNFNSASMAGYQYGIYTVSDFNSVSNSNSEDCDDFEIFGLSLGTICTSSNTSSNNSSLSGYRGLNNDGTIARNNAGSSIDSAFGGNIASLASFLANKVQESDANNGLFKYVQSYYGAGFVSYKDNMCNDANWVGNKFNGNYNFCNQVASAYSPVWMITVNGKKMIIDLRGSLMNQPVVRATTVGVSAY
ncbi:hypothetical protein ACRXCV_15530 [Halobacteriovorax sp. GFR7]|uniref:hypothetical protein n=1 Tax=unclassified Halobacteriovorax TaxID=2639665 RepID=UPI003D95382D